MDVGWKHEVVRLLGTDELRIGVLLLLMGGVGAVATGALKTIRWCLSKHQERTYRGYATSISFGADEVKAALRGYVFHEGMQTDPSTRHDLAEAFAMRRRCLFKMLDEAVISPEAGKYVFLFADCGMGKTTFLINYFHRRRSRLKKHGLAVVLVSLSRTGYLDEINGIAPGKRAETVLLMDAFDEDPLVFDGVRQRLGTILALTSSFKSVVISCRSQFFASSSEIPVETGVLRTGPTPLAESKEYEFKRLYIAPFDEKHVRKYLRTAFPGVSEWFKRRRAREMLNRTPTLAMRPMLLAHISDVLEEDNRESEMTQSDIYQAIVAAWVRREKRWVEEKPLLDFSKKLALDLFEKRHVRGGEFCSRQELLALAEVWRVQIRAEFLTGRSLLNRTEDGSCKFAHRSIMEFLAATAIVEGTGQGQVELTDQMAMFIFDQVGIIPAFPEGRLDHASRAVQTDAEVRLGYPTNYNLYHADSRTLDPSHVYGIWVTDEIGEGDNLGEHIQYMISQLERGSRVQDVRISVSPSDSSALTAYVSVWSSEVAVLSRLTMALQEWLSVVGDGWLGRRFYNVVGRPTTRGHNAADLQFSVETLCNLPVDFLGVDAADRCQLLSAGNGEVRQEVELRLICGIGEPGPLAPFGILKGGRMSHLEGNKSRHLHRRAVDRVPDRLTGDIVHELPLVSSAEKWPTGRWN